MRERGKQVSYVQRHSITRRNSVPSESKPRAAAQRDAGEKHTNGDLQHLIKEQRDSKGVVVKLSPKLRRKDIEGGNKQERGRMVQYINFDDIPDIGADKRAGAARASAVASQSVYSFPSNDSPRHEVEDSGDQLPMSRASRNEAASFANGESRGSRDSFADFDDDNDDEYDDVDCGDQYSVPYSKEPPPLPYEAATKNASNAGSDIGVQRVVTRDPQRTPTNENVRHSEGRRMQSIDMSAGKHKLNDPPGAGIRKQVGGKDAPQRGDHRIVHHIDSVEDKATGTCYSHRRKIEYKPYTLEQYRQIRPKQYMEISNMKPDLNSEELQAKRANKERVKEFSSKLKSFNKDVLDNQRKLPQSSEMSDIEVSKKKMESRREKALQFAKNIPKPKVRHASFTGVAAAADGALADGESSLGAGASGYLEDNGIGVVENSALSELDAKHEANKRQVDAIKRSLGLM
jgi:hypothetical protein